MNLGKLIPAVAGLVFLSGCAIPLLPGVGNLGGNPFPRSVPVLPPTGGLYTDFKAPLSLDTPVKFSSSTRMGVSESSYVKIPFIWLDFAWGDASIKKAASNGNISRVAHVDYQVMQIIGLYGRFTVMAYGD